MMEIDYNSKGSIGINEVYITVVDHKFWKLWQYSW